MSSVSIGFFVFPAEHLGELLRLDEQWGASLDNLKDDFQVRYNDLYRAAAGVAIHRAELPGEEMDAALSEVAAFIRGDVLRDRRRGSVFSPTEAQAQAHRVGKVERRAGSVAKVVARIAKRDRSIPDEAYHRVYDAFKEALGAAVSQDAGLIWATLRPGAEAELAERRAREEQEAREEAEAYEAWMRLSPEERAAIQAEREAEHAREHAELEALIEERLLKKLDQERADREDLSHVWLCFFPAAEAGEVRALLGAAYERYEANAYSEARDLFDQVRAHLEARAQEIVVLYKHGAYLALRVLEQRLRRDEPGAHEPTGIYAPARAQALLEALGRWEARAGGEAGVVGELSEESWIPEPLVTAAYRACKRALAQAVARPCALFWLLDDRREILAGLPATKGL